MPYLTMLRAGDKDDITDADIDAILAAGEAKTKDMQDAGTYLLLPLSYCLQSEASNCLVPQD